MRGIAYGVGVGPGDPELMTLKAVRLIRENDVIAVPGKTPQASVAYRIAAAAVPELRDKTLLCVDMPMTRERAALQRAHRDGAERLERMLDEGKNVVYLTLGDPTVYCSFGYLRRILEADGYPVELVPGVASFCAAAARLNLPLAEGEEPLHVLPAVRATEEALRQSGTCVLMKSGGRMAEIKEVLRRSGRDVYAVENCGMDNERVCRSAEELPDEAGYFSLIIAREHRGESGQNRSTDE